MTQLFWIGRTIMCETCKFCHSQEPNSDQTLICCGCVQRLLSLDKEQIRVMHAACVEQGQIETAELLEKLLMENTDGKQPKSYFEKRLDGARPTRFIGLDKNSSHRPSIKQKVAVH